MIAPEILTALPSPGQRVWRLLRTLARRSTASVAVPAFSVEVPALAADARLLQTYRTICGFRDRGLPITFPQVQAAALQIYALTHRRFPIPLLGVVLVRNVITQFQPLDSGRDYRVRVDVLGSKTVEKGIEFSLATRYYQDDVLVWEAISTGLQRSPRRSASARRSGPPDVLESFEPWMTFDVSSSAARRYARISRDMNPIHLSRWGGRLFGFPGQIAHGMWVFARCLALMPYQWPGHAIEMAIEFKQPLVLPARVSVLRVPGDDPLRFAVTALDRGRLHLLASIAVPASQAGLRI